MKKIADLNAIADVKPEEVHFSKVHAHIIEGNDKKIYFTGILDDGGLAGSQKILAKWTNNVQGGKLYQYDPVTDESIVYVTLPEATVTATLKYDPKRNLLYCSLEGNRRGFALGVFDMEEKKWIYIGTPGEVSGQDRNLMLDTNGNLYFNGKETFDHKGKRLKAQLEAWERKKEEMDAPHEETKPTSTSVIAKKPSKVDKYANEYTTLWKYDPTINEVEPTNTYFTSMGFRSATRESKEGYIYGTTRGGELFSYLPGKYDLQILGSNFLKYGEYLTMCTLSPDEKYLYYLPGAHGSAGFSATPVIQYDIKKGTQKALAFLYGAMNKVFRYEPGGTYGLKMSADGSELYVGLNGSPPESMRPKELHSGFGLTSFAVIHIPVEERNDL